MVVILTPRIHYLPLGESGFQNFDLEPQHESEKLKIFKNVFKMS
jgi:hypothetical protein